MCIILEATFWSEFFLYPFLQYGFIKIIEKLFYREYRIR